jgi:ABC-type phosphate/phosphonate transport system substrate-binding protein
VLSAVLLGGAALALVPAAGAEGTDSRDGDFRIGLIRSLFRDTPEATVRVLMQPFGSLMESQTGLNADLVTARDSQDLGQRLKDGKVQLGVFHGVELAWAQKKYPELKPLMIAINKDRHLYAYLVIRKDSKATGLADLKGKILALPRKSREHCYLFLEHLCKDAGVEAKRYFAKVVNPAGIECALDDVVRGKVDAAMVDAVSFDSYKREKPGCCGRLKVLKQSETFPAAAIAYFPGNLDEARLQQFRDGMLRANQTTLGKQLLSLWHLTAFEEVPDDYQKTLADIVKSYPAPCATERTSAAQAETK